MPITVALNFKASRVRSSIIKGWIIGSLVVCFVIYDIIWSPEITPKTQLTTVEGKIELVLCHKGDLDAFKLEGFETKFSTFHFERTSCEKAKAMYQPGMAVALKYPEHGTSIYEFSANNQVVLTYEQILGSKGRSRIILYGMAFLFMGLITFGLSQVRSKEI